MEPTGNEKYSAHLWEDAVEVIDRWELICFSADL